MKVYGRNITEQDMNEIARFMDDGIREELHAEMAPCSPDKFLEAYIQRVPEFEEQVLEEMFQFER